MRTCTHGEWRVYTSHHRLNYLKNIPQRYLIQCVGWVSQQTLYHLVTVKQGVARLESSSLHLRGVGLIHCHLKISRPCWTRLTTLVMNLLCLLVSLLLHSAFTPNISLLTSNDGWIESNNLPLPNSSHFLPVNSSSACFSPPHHHRTISPHMAQQPQAIRSFFSAVGTLVPYNTFMHFPAFPIISIPMPGFPMMSVIRHTAPAHL